MTGPEGPNPDMPYRDNGVTFIQWLPGGRIATTNEVGAKREMLAGTRPVYAAWNGQRRTDVFEVDRKAARTALA